MISRVSGEIQKLTIASVAWPCGRGNPTKGQWVKDVLGPAHPFVGEWEGRNKAKHSEQNDIRQGFTISSRHTGKKQNLTKNRGLSVELTDVCPGWYKNREQRTLKSQGPEGAATAASRSWHVTHSWLLQDGHGKQHVWEKCQG